MVEFKITGEALWSRMERAVEKVNERLRRTVDILEEANVSFSDPFVPFEVRRLVDYLPIARPDGHRLRRRRRCAGAGDPVVLMS